MIKINNIEIAETYDEYGIQWQDGEETWDVAEEDARVITWSCEGSTLLKRTVFVTAAEVQE